MTLLLYLILLELLRQINPGFSIGGPALLGLIVWIIHISWHSK